MNSNNQVTDEVFQFVDEIWSPKEAMKSKRVDHTVVVIPDSWLCRHTRKTYFKLGADTGIPSGGCEIWKREHYTKKGKKAIFYLNYLFKIRSDSNVLN